ncbi:MAG TPA: hypothetical protein PLB05_07155 [Candidatus Omnitrophota bacterium]|jgi:uncharacterized protein (UPF0333 family)|nr:hypothetical protein [Candidatus Omnitrophota bacterium]HPN55294.1 hypothetical protein [Candidatus Omnitrophota bacterium]
MKKTCVFLLGLLLISGLVTPVMAQFEETTEVAVEAETVTGQIVSVSEEGGSLILKYIVDEETGRQMTVTLNFNEESEITLDGVAVSFSDLKVGDTITASFVKESDATRVVTTASVQAVAE